MDRRERLVAAGAWLRAQRERRGIAARDMAAQLEVFPQTVYNWEAGKTGVDDDRAEQIAKLLDVDLIEARRNLGLWVPPERPPGAETRYVVHEQTTDEVPAVDGAPLTKVTVTAPGRPGRSVYLDLEGEPPEERARLIREAAAWAAEQIAEK